MGERQGGLLGGQGADTGLASWEEHWKGPQPEPLLCLAPFRGRSELNLLFLCLPVLPAPQTRAPSAHPGPKRGHPVSNPQGK